MKKNKNLLFVLILTPLLFTSCQKVIPLDLNTAAPQLVIQGDVYNGAGPFEVKISKTVNFDTPNIYPAVTNATVTISDNSGQMEDLSQSVNGTYVTSSLLGLIGHTYTLTVKVDGKTYTANSTMPESVNIDTIYYRKSVFGGSKLIALDLVNTPDKDNYYQVVHFVNGKQVPGFSVFSEHTSQAQIISYSFMSTNTTPELVSGDKIDVWLECIDKGVFEYFRTANRDGGRSASPANPVSNICNGALGYFNACSVQKKQIIYKK